MKFFAAAWGMIGVCAACYFGNPPPAPTKLLILGNHRGYLSPCGCSEPMLGGILRQATLINSYKAKGATVVIDTGGLTGETTSGRQERLKAQALAMTFKSLGVMAVNLNRSDLSLGVGDLLNLQTLSHNAFIGASGYPEVPTDAYREADGLIVGGLNQNSDPNLLVTKLLNAADLASEIPALMLDGDQLQAIKLAQEFPKLKLITYNSTAKPGLAPMMEGSTLIVSPGEHGQYLLSLSVQGNRFTDYQRQTLGPEIPDDPKAIRIYKIYLHRVDQEGLWKEFLSQKRSPTKKFAGSGACEQCHQKDYRIWKNSGHSHATETLIARGHDHDPECLPCHVTGAYSLNGFVSPLETPKLGEVGCESCHGPGAAHAAQPRLNRMGTVKPATCTMCHTNSNSPAFEVHSFWDKIRHGNGDNKWINPGNL